MYTKTKINKLAEKVIGRIIQHEIGKWPPDCPLLAFQPERPNSTFNKAPERTSDKQTS